MIDFFPDQGSIRFYKVRDAGGVMNATIELVRRNAREVFVSFFALVVPFGIIAGIGQALYYRSLGNFLDPGAVVPGSELDFLADIFSPTYIVTVLIGVIGTSVAGAAGAGYVRLYRQEFAGEITPSLLWEETRGLVIPTIGFGFAYTLLLIVSGVVNIIPCLGQIAWLAFIIWTLPYATVAWASRMTESGSIAESVRRAQMLVKGSWGFSFGALALSWLLVVAVSFVVALPLQVVLGVATQATSNPTAIFGALSVLTIPLQILGYVAYLVPAIVSFFIHGRLATELDGLHLDEQLDILETGVDATSAATWNQPSAGPTEAGTGDATRLGDSDATRLSDPDATRLGDPDETIRPNDDDRPSPGGFRGGGFGS